MIKEYGTDFYDNLDKYSDFVSWARWFPDLFYDLITPETGGIRLDLDQRVFLRSLARFASTYGVMPRGYGKTYIEVLGMVHASLWFPDIEIAMSAQTKENAAAILEEKWHEIERHYPLLKNELDGKPSFTKDTAEIKFLSGGKIDVLANAQSSKGRRRKRLNIEEAAQMNDKLFQDVLEPIPNVPRRTIGKESLINHEELNGQINFFTTSWYRGTSEFERSIRMVDEMAELKGVMIIGSDWQLACHYGRGETKGQILRKKENSSPTFFALNYESRWVGTTDGALVNINKVYDLRTLKLPEYKSDGNSDYIIAVDVARSVSQNNNQSSIAVLKIKRNALGKIMKIQLVNLINLPSGLNFTGQAIEVKRTQALYKANAVVVDANGVGSGLLDELMKETFDPITGDSLGCWDTMNTEHEPEIPRSEKILFALMAQGINHEIIVNFIDIIESEKLQLLIKDNDNNYDINDSEYANKKYPFIQTDLLIEEIANLKLKETSSKKFTVERVVGKINKDRYSAVAMAAWYVKNFEEKVVSDDFNWSDYMLFN